MIHVSTRYIIPQNLSKTQIQTPVGGYKQYYNGKYMDKGRKRGRNNQLEKNNNIQA